MCASNVWGLLMLIVLLGYGLIEVPRHLYYSSLPHLRLRYLYLTAPSTKHDMEECMDRVYTVSIFLKSFSARVFALKDDLLTE